MNKFESSPIVKGFRGNLIGLSKKSSLSLICGVSGGIDSMVLLYLLHRHEIKCTVAHCNYQLRGKESDKDMELVEEISSMWGFECITARFEPDEAKESNTQIWARDLRYAMFRDLKHELNAGFIVTAHHQEDQIETILQKLLRGSGPAAWGGMNVIDGDLFRPLLNVTKQEIREFADDYHVPYRDDETNQSSKYARNFIRNDLAPQLDKLIPGWKQNVLKIPERAIQFQAMTDTLLNQIEIKPAAISRRNLLALPQSVWPALIHRFIEKNGDQAHITSGDLKQVRSLAELQTGASLEFGNDHKIVRDREFFRLITGDSSHLNHVTIRLENLPFRSDRYGIQLDLKSWDGNIQKGSLQVDAKSISWPIKLRLWKNGDKMQPFGMKGHKLISDILTDSKISSVQKKDAFLIESFDGIIYAVIFPHQTSDRQIGVISDIVKCTSVTKKVLLIDTDV